MSPQYNYHLADVPIGCSVRIRELWSGQPTVSARLRELGFCENAIVRCVNKGSGNIICEVCNTRVGLNISIASNIFVSTFE